MTDVRTGAGTGPAPQDTSPQDTGPRTSPQRAWRPWIRRHRALAALAAIVVAAMCLVVWNQLAPKGNDTPLSAGNAGPDGARAVTRILARHGVNVHEADTFEAARAALDAGPSPTLLLYDRYGFLDERRLLELAAAAERLVLVTPRLETLTALDGSIRQAGVVPDAVPLLAPGCPLPDAQAAGEISGAEGFVYDGGVSCYRPGGSSAGLLSVSLDGRLFVLGSTAVLGNGLLDEQGNAALALRTLGSSQDLVWYLPSVADLEDSGSPATLEELAPDWVRFLGPWLLVVALAAIAWRGRRLGPLVFEPLPVVVKAVETAEGRARMYHDAHALDQARDNLRAGTLVRLAAKLRLGPGSGADTVIDAAALAAGRPATGVRELLNERPGSEARLVAWAQELNNLEKEVSGR